MFFADVQLKSKKIDTHLQVMQPVLTLGFEVRERLLDEPESGASFIRRVDFCKACLA